MYKIKIIDFTMTLTTNGMNMRHLSMDTCEIFQKHLID